MGFWSFFFHDDRPGAINKNNDDDDVFNSDGMDSSITNSETILGVNPASGLPMMDSMLDVAGSPYGTDIHNTNSISAFDDSFSSHDSVSINCDSSDMFTDSFGGCDMFDNSFSGFNNDW